MRKRDATYPERESSVGPEPPTRPAFDDRWFLPSARESSHPAAPAIRSLCPGRTSTSDAGPPARPASPPGRTPTSSLSYAYVSVMATDDTVKLLLAGLALRTNCLLLFPTRADQPLALQCLQQQIQHPLLQTVLATPGPE